MSPPSREASAAPQLPPFPYRLGVLEPYYAAESTTLILRQKLASWSANDFSVKTIAGEPLLKVEGKAISFTRQIKVTDLQGEHLFTIRQDPWSWRGSFYAEGPTGLRFLNVKGHVSCKYLASPYPPFFFSFPSSSLFLYSIASPTHPSRPRRYKLTGANLVSGRKYTISFLNASSGQPVELTMKGNFWDTKADIKLDDGSVAAVITRQVKSARAILGGMQDYCVTIAPNVDMALVVATCICLDEVNRGSNGS